MRALTFHQPVATLMGHKDIENRTWRPYVDIMGQRIAIHAGKMWNKSYSTWARRLTEHDTYDGPVVADLIQKAEGIRGAIVSTAVMTAWYDARTGTTSGGEQARAIASNPWFLGPVGWLLTDFRYLPEPIPCRGAQGLWTVPPAIEAQL